MPTRGGIFYGSIDLSRMPAKPLNLKSPQGRQITRMLTRRSRLQVSVKSQAVVQSAGRTLQVWIMEPTAPPFPQSSRKPVAAPPVLARIYSWSAAQPADSPSAADSAPLLALSQRAIAFMRESAEGDPAFTLGLDADEFNSLRTVLGEAVLGSSLAHTEAAKHPAPELAQLLAWLWSFRRSDAPLTRAVAAALACACFRSQHLWDELGLAGRDPLNTLLSGHFPQLYRMNYTHMGWKKFILLQQTTAGAARGEAQRSRAAIQD